MGPLLLTGLAIFGGLIALGIVASTPRRSTGDALTEARRLAVILVAIITGCAVVAVVVGVLAISVGARLGPGSTRLLITLTVAGALIGAFIVLRSGRSVDRSIVRLAASMGGGLVVLGAVVAVLSLVIHRFSSGSTPEWVYLVLGLVAAGGAIGLGIIGSRAIAELGLRGGLDGPAGAAARSAAIRRVLPFYAVAYGAALIGIVLVVIR